MEHSLLDPCKIDAGQRASVAERYCAALARGVLRNHLATTWERK